MVIDDLHEYAESGKAIGQAIRDNDQDAIDEALAQQSKVLNKMIDMEASLFTWRLLGVVLLLMIFASILTR
jgi:hypothetical protein